MKRAGRKRTIKNNLFQRWSRGHKARGQGQGQGHKKIRGQGQGQPFRGQTLLRPRTGMLEAKAKAKDFKMCPRGRPRGQGRPRGLHL